MSIVIERTFRIQPGSFAEFERLSREHIWPYMEARGVKFIGLFQQIHGGPSNEIVLLTSYDSFAHWEATRPDAEPGEDVPQEARELAARCAIATRERQKLVEVTWTRALSPATPSTDLSSAPR